MTSSGLLALEAADRAAVRLGLRLLKGRGPEARAAVTVHEIHQELGNVIWATARSWGLLSRSGSAPCRLHPGQDQDDCTFCDMLEA